MPGGGWDRVSPVSSLPVASEDPLPRARSLGHASPSGGPAPSEQLDPAQGVCKRRSTRWKPLIRGDYCKRSRGHPISSHYQSV